ncbi:LPS translocon maturation chaperone LptM [Rickettsia endosymbiont of Urophora cardui]
MKKFDFVVLLLLCTMLCSCGIKKPLEPPTDVSSRGSISGS